MVFSVGMIAGGRGKALSVLTNGNAAHAIRNDQNTKMKNHTKRKPLRKLRLNLRCGA